MIKLDDGDTVLWCLRGSSAFVGTVATPRAESSKSFSMDLLDSWRTVSWSFIFKLSYGLPKLLFDQRLCFSYGKPAVSNLKSFFTDCSQKSLVNFISLWRMIYQCIQISDNVNTILQTDEQMWWRTTQKNFIYNENVDAMNAMRWYPDKIS
jgi:hypothetical protein